MTYIITAYSNGKRIANGAKYATLGKSLYVAFQHLEHGADEYEITNERGDVVAYAYTEDSPKAIEKANDYAADMKEARADMAGEIQRDELRELARHRGGKS